MKEIVISKQELLSAIEAGKVNKKEESLNPGEKTILELRGKKKKVAICGFAPYSLSETPWNNDEFEFWGLNELYIGTPPKFTRWFEMHHRSIIERTRRDHNHLEWLQKAQIPIYMQEHYEDIPFSVKYPKEEMFQKFRPYFTNSISWMLAVAIDEGFEEIHVYGVDMAVEGEYSWERPSCEYFLGVAEGRGIRVYIPRQSDLLKAQYEYGYQDQQPALDKADARITDFNSQLQRLAMKESENLCLLYAGIDRIPVTTDNRDLIIQLKTFILEMFAVGKVEAKLNGAIEDTNYHKRIWSM